MKRIFLPAVITFYSVLIGSTVFSQTTKNRAQKNEEIIIRKNDDSKSKTIIVVDSNDITINGQPLSDYKGDVQVFTRKFMRGNPENVPYLPELNFRMNSFNGTRTFLGVLTEKSDKGALIKTVTKGSSAEKAGLKEQDIITGFGGTKISTAEDLAKIVKAYKPGDEVKITYLRNGKKKNAKVILGKTNANPMAFNFKMDSLNLNNRNFNFKMPDLSRLDNLRGSYFDLYNHNQPKIGLRIQEMEDSSGVKILNVEEGSPADKAGLKKDDIIREVNGEKVNTVNDVRAELNNSKNKEHYTIKAQRNSSGLDFEIKVPKKLNSADL